MRPVQTTLAAAVDEPLSPELALVDPELAARARAALPLPILDAEPSAIKDAVAHGDFQFKAGQFISMVAMNGEKQITRAYSIASGPRGNRE